MRWVYDQRTFGWRAYGAQVALWRRSDFIQERGATYRPPARVAIQLRKAECLIHDTLSCKRRVAMHHH